MLKQTAESPDRGLVLNFGGDARSLVDLGDFTTVVFGHQDAEPISWDIEWRSQIPATLTATPDSPVLDSEERGYKATIRVAPLLGSPSSGLVVDDMQHKVGITWFGMRRRQKERGGYELFSTDNHFEFIRARGRVWDLPEPVKSYGFPDEVRAYFQNAGFLSDLEFGFENLLKNVYYLGPLRAYPARQYSWAGTQPADMGRTGDLAVDALLASRDRGETISLGRGKKRPRLDEYVAEWLHRLGLIDSFEVNRIAKGSKLYEVLLRKSALSPEVLITDVGFGVSQILPVIVLCFYVPEGSTIILEQPEIHLHPAVQAGLADVLIDATEKRHIQILVESHSEHLLRRLQRRVAEHGIAEQGISKDRFALYFCRHNGYESELTPLELDVFGVIRNWPKDFFGDEFEEIAATNRAAQQKKKSQAG